MHIWLNQFLKASMQVHINLDPAYCDEFKFNSTVCHIQTCVNMLRSQFHQLIHSLLFAKCTILCVHVYLHVIVIHCIFYVNMSIYQSVTQFPQDRKFGQDVHYCVRHVQYIRLVKYSPVFAVCTRLCVYM